MTGAVHREVARRQLDLRELLEPHDTELVGGIENVACALHRRRPVASAAGEESSPQYAKRSTSLKTAGDTSQMSTSAPSLASAASAASAEARTFKMGLQHMCRMCGDALAADGKGDV